MKMFCWRAGAFVAIAQAVSVAAAREALLEQIGESAERDVARRFVLENTPDIWHGPNAEFVVTDSGVIQKLDREVERLRTAAVGLKEELEVVTERLLKRAGL